MPTDPRADMVVQLTTDPDEADALVQVVGDQVLTVTPADEGKLVEVGAGGQLVLVDPVAEVLDTAAITTDARFRHPLPTPVLSGTFVAPESGAVRIATELHGNNPGLAYANLDLIVGVPVNGRLHGTGHYAPLVAGVQRHIVGRAHPDAIIDQQREDVFDGLTPGVEYTWAIEVVIVGGSEQFTLTGATAVVILPDGSKGYVFSLDTGVNGIKPLVRGGRANWSVTDLPAKHSLGATIAHPSGPYGLYRARATPDGTKIVATALLSTGVVVLNTATDVATKLGNPASGTAPYPVVCRSNTEAIVGFSGTGRICSLALDTNTWGTPVTPGRAITALGLDEARTVLYAGGTDGFLLRYPSFPNTGDATGSDIGGRIEDIAWGGDRVWVALPNELRSVHPTTFATIDSISLPSTPNKIAVTADYGVVWVVLQNGVVRYYPTAAMPSLPPNNEHDSPDLGTSGVFITLGPDEYIYVTVDNTLTVWPGSTFGVLAQSGDGVGGIAPEFLDHGLTVEVTAEP